ncbi:PilZ domain-containing protein [Desulfovibrio sp. OttesenSCG-928-M16]|nr:PilZ domain-containing protein [Desulfovibrio sp. OttesenSCG-928-M16]
MAAHNSNTDSQSYANRRSSLRVPIDVPFFVSMQKSMGREDIPALLVDCGRGGVQLAFSPASGGVASWLGSEVRIDGLPLLLDTQGTGFMGTITWVSSERCGVRFHVPLPVSDKTIAALSDAL